MNENLCPVCGYDLGVPAWKGLSPSDKICPSCGIQFGYADFAGGSIEKRKELYRFWREAWIASGKTFIPKTQWKAIISRALSNTTCPPPDAKDINTNN